MKIYQIEITNACQFRCDYCPRTTAMTRKVGSMSNETINRIADVLTSDSIRLHHYGESLIELDKTLYAIKALKNKNPELVIELNTNGEYLTPETTDKLFEAGLSKVNLSYHFPPSIKHLKNIDPKYRERIEVMKIAHLSEIEKYKNELKEVKEIGYKVILKQLRDLGQVNADSAGKGNAWKECSFIKNNEFVVLWDGRIVTCCEVFDGEPEEILGSIFDDSLPEKNKYISKCATCMGYGNGDIETEKINI